MAGSSPAMTKKRDARGTNARYCARRFF